MARPVKEIKSKKETEVSDIVDIGKDIQGDDWSAAQVQAESTTHLEDDTGSGGAAIIRCFQFAANPEAFRLHKPTRQELFNSHLKGIEVMLWRDGMKLLTDVNPKVTVNKKQNGYRIFVSAVPAKGHILTERPQILSEIVKKQ